MPWFPLGLRPPTTTTTTMRTTRAWPKSPMPSMPVLRASWTYLTPPTPKTRVHPTHLVPPRSRLPPLHLVDVTSRPSALS